MKIKYFLFSLIFYLCISVTISKNPEKSYISFYDDNIDNKGLNENEKHNKSYLEKYIIYSGNLLTKIVERNDISENCRTYLNGTILATYNKYYNKSDSTIKNITTKVFEHKTVIENIFQSSSIKKNELSYFQGCLYQKNYSYFVVVVDTTKDTTIVNSTTDNTNKTSELEIEEYEIKKKFLNYEDSFYLYGFCLPYKNRDIVSEDEVKYNDLYCNVEDYKIILTVSNNDLYYFLFPNNSDIDILSTRSKRNSEPFSLIMLIIMILFFSLILFNNTIFLFLKKFCYKDNNNKIEEEKIEENEEEKQDENMNKNKDTKLEKLKKILNCFIFQKNLEELINIKTNSTDVNNYSGLTEIRGLIAISIIFTLLGSTFIAIYNSPLKMAGLATMRKLLKNIWYTLVFIGIRYSPRVIFSCSGYTLSYKYLSFIEKNSEKLSCFKFLFYQFHKYFLLTFFVLCFRYTLNYFIILTKKDILPNWVFFQYYILKNDKEDSNFWLSFFGINLFFEDQTKRADQILIDYFWIPINEIYFFIFGVILITIGYKFKLKIDIFILFLIFIGFTGKIIFSYFYRDEFYSTLYYYLFDYGKFMINPIFNLTYYLIGLYFGLINFTLQKGITNQFDSTLYKKIKALKFEKNEDEKDEEIEGENNELIVDEGNNNLERNSDIDGEEKDDDDNNKLEDEQNNVKKKRKE